MSEYNTAFNFNTPDGAYDMPGSLNAEPVPAMDQSGTWTAALYSPSGLMEGGTAAQLHARLDFAPFEGARSNGAPQHNPADSNQRSQADLVANHACAVCHKAYQNASALDSHAREATHRAYKCKCGTSFNKHSALKRHINTKDAPKTFACTLCSNKFTRIDKLRDHCRQYHRVTDEGLKTLLNSKESRPRGAGPRRLRARDPLAAASTGPAPTLTPAIPPVLAAAPAGPSVWSAPAYTTQQYNSFSTDPFALVDPFVTTSSFAPAAGHFTSAPVPDEDVAGGLDDIFGDATWATGFDGFNC